MKLKQQLRRKIAPQPVAARRGPVLGFLTMAGQNWTKLVLGIASLILLTASAQGANNWYVRPGSAGSNNGTDWNNAWSATSINWSSVAPGDTIWLAGGSYPGGLSFGKSGTANSPITVKRVLSTDATPVAAAGWSSAFDSLATFPGVINFSGGPNYTTLDGRYEYGIKITFGTGSHGIVIASGGTTSMGVTIQYVEVAGPGQPTVESDAVSGVSWNGSQNASIVNTRISHCFIHGSDTLIMRASWLNSIVEYTKLFDSFVTTGVHPDVVYSYPCTNSIFRYNIISNNFSEAIFYSYGYSTGEYWYGNTFVSGSGYAFEVRITSDIGGMSYGTFYLYNNTFKDWGYGAVYLAGPISSGSQIYNNIFVNCGAGPNYRGAAASDYNYYSTGVTGDGGANSLFGASPFVAPNANLHLLAGSGPINKGKTLTADGFMNKDADGSIRGADGTWDIGAFEYPTGGPSTNPAIAISPTTLTFAPALPGKSTTNYITVQNVGSGLLAGVAAINGTSTNFTVLAPQAYSLSAGQSAPIGVRYTPGSANDSATVNFSGGGNATAIVSGRIQAVLSGLAFPSYAGVVTAPFTTNGGYLSQTVDVSGLGAAGMAGGGQAVYAFNVSTPGNYTVSANVNAPNASSKSCWVNMDGLPVDPTMIWDVFPYTSGFETRAVSWRGTGTSTNDQFAPAIFNLSAGIHQLFIVGREPGIQIGNITIAPYNTNSILPPTVSPIASSASDVDPTRIGLQIFAGSAVQYSGSATDPNGYPMSWQWLYTVNGGAETVYSSGTGAPSGISFNYGSSTAGGTYVWKLRVSNGHLTSESDLTVGVEAPPVAGGGLSFQAAAGVLSGPFALANGAISQTTETGVTNGGQAVFTFTITTAGNYVVQALVNAPSAAANSFFVNIDGQPQDPTMIFDAPLTSGFEQRIVSWRGNGTDVNDQFVPKTFNLAAGVHQLIIVGREANTQLQSVSILPLPAPPQNLRIVAGL